MWMWCSLEGKIYYSALLESSVRSNLHEPYKETINTWDMLLGNSRCRTMATCWHVIDPPRRACLIRHCHLQAASCDYFNKKKKQEAAGAAPGCYLLSAWRYMFWVTNFQLKQHQMPELNRKVRKCRNNLYKLADVICKKSIRIATSWNKSAWTQYIR